MRFNVLISGITLAVTLISASAMGQATVACDQSALPGSICDEACRCSPSGFVGGAEAVFLQRYYHNNLAVQNRTDDQQFIYDFQVSPRFWLGYENEDGLGVRARYWGYDETSSVSSAGGNVIITGINYFIGVGAPVSDRLRAFTLDGEVTQKTCLGSWQVEFGGGLRGLSMYQDTRMVSDVDLPVYSVGSINSEFDGAGPTLSIEAKRPIGCNGFALLGNARGSYLFGSRTRIEATDVIGNTNASSRHFESRHTDTLSIGEIQLGIEWSRCLGNGSHLAIQGLWEGQLWTGAGGPWGSQDDLGLMGFALSVGITH